MKLVFSIKFFSLLLLGLFLLSAIAHGAPGDVDLTFNPGNITYVFGTQHVYAVVVQSDGKILTGRAFRAVGGANSFFGNAAGQANTSGSNNSFFGRLAGDSNMTGNNNTIIGDGADVGSGSLSNATAIGSNVVVTTSNSIMLGRAGLDNEVAANRMTVSSIPLLASAAQVCFNAIGDLLQCGASSLRLKQDVQPFVGGLDIVRRLRPITYNWKENGMADLGLGAEDVAQIAPSFVFTNEKGEAEGVRYDRLNILLINAVKEQQLQIEAQKAEIEALKSAICELKPTFAICEK